MLWLLNLGFAAGFQPEAECNLDLFMPIVNDSMDVQMLISSAPTDVSTTIAEFLDVSTPVVIDSLDVETEIDDSPTDVSTEIC